MIVYTEIRVFEKGIFSVMTRPPARRKGYLCQYTDSVTGERFIESTHIYEETLILKLVDTIIQNL